MGPFSGQDKVEHRACLQTDDVKMKWAEARVDKVRKTRLTRGTTIPWQSLVAEREKNAHKMGKKGFSSVFVCHGQICLS